MDDGFVLWPPNAYINVIRDVLNELLSLLKFKVGKENVFMSKSWYVCTIF